MFNIINFLSTIWRTPGRSKAITVVAVCFGLMCILQAALNVSLRLRGGGECHPAVTKTRPWRCRSVTPAPVYRNSVIFFFSPCPTDESRSSSGNCSELITNDGILEMEEMMGSGATPDEGLRRWQYSRFRQEKNQLLRQKFQMAQENDRLKQENDELAVQKNILHRKLQDLTAANLRLKSRNSQLARQVNECEDRHAALVINDG